MNYRSYIASISVVFSGLTLRAETSFGEMMSQSMYKTSSFGVLWNISDPGIAVGGQLNLAAKASIALELATGGVLQDLSPRELEKNPNDTMVTEYRAGRIVFSRFSEPELMSGFFWTLGAGYRTQTATWLRTPWEKENVTSLNLNSTGQTQEKYRLSGTTGHGRIGYKYTGQSAPFFAGIHIGLQHFQATVDEVYEKTDEEPATKDKVHSEVKSSLKRRWMTTSDLAISVGLTL